ncbi:hypothetical protein PVAP13_2KG002400 [Panicum virgatum]|uniref:F-box domain-containing protein n=1 Tax=Panicum virgatum TaxID=38727 RepID=A0A8T0W0W3_PANVG|nr:hypothetical protein PVAP13_2KG002400 [Panicum virgatum]
MGVVVTRAARKRRLEEEERLRDHISGLPDAVLGEIVSLLPTKEGARTQALSSRWRHIWASASLPLLDLRGESITSDEVSRILSSHRGPVRRFFVRVVPREGGAATLDGWLRSPALNNLHELDFHLSFPHPPPLPEPARRFAPTLRAASFGGCSFSDGDATAGALHLPLLKQLSLVNARISAGSLHALIAGCPVLESLLLVENLGCPRTQIVSPSLRSIAVCSGSGGQLRLQRLIIEDAPCLERLLFFRDKEDMDISVISAPRLAILGKLTSNFLRLQFGTTTSLSEGTGNGSSLGSNIQLHGGKKNAWRLKYRNLIGTLDIHLKEIVLAGYLGNKSHVNFAKFFMSKARVLESVTLELLLEEDGNRTISSAWVETQRRLLQINKRARHVQFDFVPRNMSISRSLSDRCERKQLHDLSAADPFESFR